MPEPKTFSIRQLFTSLAGFYILLLVITLLLTRLWWFYPNELALFEEQQAKQLQSLDATLGILRSQLLDQVTDYSQREKARLFFESPQKRQQIVQENAFNMQLLGIQAVLMVDKKHQLIFAAHQNQGTIQDIHQDSTLKKWVADSVASGIYSKAPKQDIIRLQGQDYFLAISPTFAKTKHPIGWLIFLQELDASLWQKVENITLLQITTVPPSVALTQKDYHCLMNIYAKPALCLDVHQTEFSKPSFLDLGNLFALIIIIIIPFLIFSFFLGQLLRPVHIAIKTLKTFNEEGIISPLNISYRVPIKELRELKNTYNRIVNTALRQQRELEKLSYTDRLTDIANRRAFDFILEQSWKRITRQSQGMALVLVDIDYFKAYNDHYGHQAGDIALYKVAQALAGCAKRSDELVARYGGEEFVLLVSINSQDELLRFKTRLQDAIQALEIEHQHSKASHELTISAGIAWINPSGAWLTNYSSENWLHSADTALYEAKKTGRNRSVVTLHTSEQPF